MNGNEKLITLLISIASTSIYFYSENYQMNRTTKREVVVCVHFFPEVSDYFTLISRPVASARPLASSKKYAPVNGPVTSSSASSATSRLKIIIINNLL